MLSACFLNVSWAGPCARSPRKKWGSVFSRVDVICGGIYTFYAPVSGLCTDADAFCLFGSKS